MQQHPESNRPWQRFTAFLHAESSGGLIMMCAALLALIAANSAIAPQYESVIHWPITLGFTAPLHLWVNDVGMVLFFLMIGMELKRELTEGVLVDKRQVILPLVAALGGMIMPAILFLAINHGIDAHQTGWAIPSATDIAFAVAILLLAAKNAPPALKIMLLALAIFDDLGAILIIALFYSHGIALLPLALASVAIGALALLQRKHCTKLWPYMLLGIGLCAALHQAGVHATIGGAITGLLIPMRHHSDETDSPINRGIERLHPWVSFLLLPLFAFTAAGIAVDAAHLQTALTGSLALGIILGLFLGKQLGILGASWVAVKIGIASMPPHTNWRQLHAISIIAGIGFTMSLFITNLAFTDEQLLSEAKLGVIAGSVLSALVGWIQLKRSVRA